MCISKKICAVVMKKTAQLKSSLFSVPRVNNSKNDRLKYEMIGKTQPDMEFLEEVTFIYPFSLKAGSSIPYAPRI